MVRIKRHCNTRNRQEMTNSKDADLIQILICDKCEETEHRRKPNIPELVYKFLVANEDTFDDTEHHLQRKCCCCTQEKRHDEIIDSTSQTIDRIMGYKARQRRKDSDKISKLHNVKQCSISKDLPISYLQKCADGEGTRKARNYMKKALDFGVESGYLIPFDPTHKILRVSSDLMKSDSRKYKISTCDTILSKNRNTPTRLEDLQEQRRRRRRRGRRKRGQRSRSNSRTRRRSKRRRRSRSRSRGRRRYNSPQNPEEVAEDETDDYEMDEDDPKSNIHTDDIEREPKTARSHQPDGKQSTKKAEENGSDLFIDKNETDDEDEKKRIDNT